MCNFALAWTGKCNKEGDPYCKEHKLYKCASCGEQATHECPETSTFVCGFPLCDNCEHMISEDGTNGGIGNLKHCRKEDQKYLSWYVEDLLKRLDEVNSDTLEKFIQEYNLKLDEFEACVTITDDIKYKIYTNPLVEGEGYIVAIQIKTTDRRGYYIKGD